MTGTHGRHRPASHASVAQRFNVYQSTHFVDKFDLLNWVQRCGDGPRRLEPARSPARGIGAMSRIGRVQLCLLALLIGGTADARAQDAYPSKQPIRLIVPFAAGGAVEAVARVLGTSLQVGLDQSIVIDNRGGAGGIIGMDAVAQSATRRLHIAARAQRPDLHARSLSQAAVRPGEGLRRHRHRGVGQLCAGRQSTTCRSSRWRS